MFHEKLSDLESVLDDLYDKPDPKTVNINHVFQVKKESANIGYGQEFHESQKKNLKRTMSTSM